MGILISPVSFLLLPHGSSFSLDNQCTLPLCSPQLHRTREVGHQDKELLHPGSVPLFPASCPSAGHPGGSTLPFNSALVCLALGSFSVDSFFISLFLEQQPLQKERFWALRTSTALPFLQCDLGQVTSPAGSTDGEREYLNKYK